MEVWSSREVLLCTAWKRSYKPLGKKKLEKWKWHSSKYFANLQKCLWQSSLAALASNFSNWPSTNLLALLCSLRRERNWPVQERMLSLLSSRWAFRISCLAAFLRNVTFFKAPLCWVAALGISYETLGVIWYQTSH